MVVSLKCQVSLLQHGEHVLICACVVSLKSKKNRLVIKRFVFSGCIRFV